MQYRFIEKPGADFDPDAFQLPDLLQQSKGPQLNGKSPRLQDPVLQKQAEREICRAQERPSPANQQVAQNLQAQVQLSLSERRAEILKPWILRLKALSPSAPEPERKSVLLQALEALQACYADQNRPKDLGTMGVLYPLLKCQAYKWDALQADKKLDIPAPEASYLQKLRQLKGDLGPVERAALMQLILAVNAQLPTVQLSTDPETSAVSGASAPSAPRGDKQEPTSTERVSEHDLSDFDPLAASRLSLQLRAQIQRTFSPQEKQALQLQLEALNQKQQAYYRLRQLQGLEKQIADFETDCTRFVQAKIPFSGFESWRKMRLTTLQSLARLFSQGAPEPRLLTRVESAQAHLARVGLADGADWVQSERTRRMALPSDLQPDLAAVAQTWQTALDALIDAAFVAYQGWGEQVKQAAFKKQLQALAQIQAQWQADLARIQGLEADYLACDQPTQQYEIKQTLLAAYADVLAKLPPPPAKA